MCEYSLSCSLSLPLVYTKRFVILLHARGGHFYSQWSSMKRLQNLMTTCRTLFVTLKHSHVNPMEIEQSSETTIKRLIQYKIYKKINKKKVLERT